MQPDSEEHLFQCLARWLPRTHTLTERQAFIRRWEKRHGSAERVKQALLEVFDEQKP